jgi:UDP-N-acetyl-D-glucosamine dehydrogenase
MPDDHARLAGAIRDDRLQICSDVAALSRAAAVIICVPTPLDEHLIPDLGILRAACSTVVNAAVIGQVIILTSTTYVGCTIDLLVKPLQQRLFDVGHDVFVAFSPERIDPGNDRGPHENVARVLGGVTSECSVRASAVLQAYANRVHLVSSASAAEMTKLLENTFRAVNIALANEFAEICQVLHVDVMDVINAAATKPYGFMPFFPGPGVGGHCIPCDPQYLLWQLRKHRLPTPVIEQAMAEIAGRPARVVDRIREELSAAGRGIAGVRVLVEGVAYKPNVEDLRESPALEILAGLIAAGATVGYHDRRFECIQLPDGAVLYGVDDPVEFGADLVLVHTVHSDSDLSWLAAESQVLDATYRLDFLADTKVL